jgi:Rod binding domain-containing protein
MINTDMNIKQAVDSVMQIEDRKLKKALTGFESMFVLQLLKSMRSTSMAGKDNAGLGTDTFLSITDQAFADYIGEQGSLGIAKILYKHFKNTEDAPKMADKDMAGADRIPINPDELMKTARREPDMPGTVEVNKTVNKDDFPLKANHAISIDKNNSYLLNHSTVKPEISEGQQNAIRRNDSVAVQDSINTAIDEASRKYELPRNLLEAVIKAESSGNPNAVSSKGAKGLMQLIDSTAAEMGVKDQFDPEQNIMGGAKYIRKLLDHFEGDLKLTLAAYNAGPGNVQKFGGIPPFSETRNYVDKVIKYMNDNNFGKDSKLQTDKPY